MTSKHTPVIKVLFVCLGNICRSPMAEAIFNHLINQASLQDSFYVDSAGTSGWHEGKPYHRDTQGVCERHNIPITGTSRPVCSTDYKEFDFILAMDESNWSDLQSCCPSPKYEQKIKHMLEFQVKDHILGLNVPDPYYGGYDGFERVFTLLSDSCHEFLEFVKKERGLEFRS